jgi:CheY-like chemotaxis protein
MRPVLVVEDDPDCRLLLQTWLGLLGIPTDAASNGAEALQAARARKPCLILLDFMMPVMDGLQFRLAQAADPRLADVPVVLTSAHPEARGLAAELDLADVLEKPISMDEVEAVIDRFCPPRPGHPFSGLGRTPTN